MNTVVVGLGIQGKKRLAVAGPDCIGTVDPVNPSAQYKRVEDVPLESFDSALVCTQDSAKMPILRYLLSHGKSVLVEKPLIGNNIAELLELKQMAEKAGLALYTAYNHRFEPHIAHLKKVIESGKLGKLYLAKFFYGNGTARDVRQSAWRDTGSGVLDDLGSHLLDMVHFLFGRHVDDFKRISFNRFENRAYDRILFGTPASTASCPVIEMEATLLSWRNSFYLDLFAEHGSAHIDCLCKWGPSHLSLRSRILPSGRPTEEAFTLISPDPTWKDEYEYFKKLCEIGGNNIENDIWILSTLRKLAGHEK